MAKIDLSKLKAAKPATKEHTETIAGDRQTFTITALDGAARLELLGLEGRGELINRTRLALVKGLGITPAEAEKLIQADWEAALSIAGEVVMFTCSLQKAIATEKAAAEKN